MTDGNTQIRSRWPAFVVILIFTSVHLGLTGVTIVLTFFSLGNPKLSAVVKFLTVVFLLPIELAPRGCRFESLVLPNSILYGVVWWFSWRMLRLMFARKAAE